MKQVEESGKVMGKTFVLKIQIWKETSGFVYIRDEWRRYRRVIFTENVEEYHGNILLSRNTPRGHSSWFHGDVPTFLTLYLNFFIFIQKKFHYETAYE